MLCVDNKTSTLLILPSFCIFHSSSSCMFLWPLRAITGGSSSADSSRSNRTPRGNIRDEGEAVRDRQFAPFLHHIHITILSTWSPLWHPDPLPAQRGLLESRQEQAAVEQWQQHSARRSISHVCVGWSRSRTSDTAAHSRAAPSCTESSCQRMPHRYCKATCCLQLHSVAAMSPFQTSSESSWKCSGKYQCQTRKVILVYNRLYWGIIYTGIATLYQLKSTETYFYFNSSEHGWGPASSEIVTWVLLTTKSHGAGRSHFPCKSAATFPLIYL